MCWTRVYYHPTCGHRAVGTGYYPNRIDVCHTAIQTRNTTACMANPTYCTNYVTRPYCDDCCIYTILGGVNLGYRIKDICFSLGVTFEALREANPGRLPEREVLEPPTEQE
jgi:hypothetical protein